MFAKRGTGAAAEESGAGEVAEQLFQQFSRMIQGDANSRNAGLIGLVQCMDFIAKWRPYKVPCTDFMHALQQTLVRQSSCQNMDSELLIV